MGILEALSDSLNASHYEKRDDAAIALAAKLAQEIDAAVDTKSIGDLSSRLLAVLNALGLTPMSRNNAIKGVVPNAGPPDTQNTIDELRARRTRTSGSKDFYPPD